VDRVVDITQREAEETMRALARVEGVMSGVSSGGAVSAALRLAAEVPLLQHCRPYMSPSARRALFDTVSRFSHTACICMPNRFKLYMRPA
jgi:cysteine synthase